MANAILFSWSRSVPGREMLSAEHFTQFVGYLTSLKSNGTINSFEPVFANPSPGSTVNGFFLIQGDIQKLHALSETAEWIEHMTRASMHLENLGFNFASTGSEIMSRMQVWTKSIPAK
ncbi:MAG TPA: hypothetical protein VMZ53_33510 [Kofleriaceae bacterium]|nr:hypothetical protein [Kofleriaceae bacterium]